MQRASVWRGYGYGWITLGLFVLTIVGHFLSGRFALANERTSDGEPAAYGPCPIITMPHTPENRQSETLQLIWPVGGLALLLLPGSSQSKQGSARPEAKIEEVLRRGELTDSEATIRATDDRIANGDSSRARS